MKKEILEQLGLSKNEIKVYFALLELDQASATPIVKKANIPNSKVYPILEKLIKKGLVSYVIKNNVKYFQASDPRNLIDLLKQKEKQISQQKKEIERLIPEIQEKRKLAKEKQEATIYEGIKGIKVAFNNILNTLKKDEEYQVFTLGEELKTRALRIFFQNFHRERVKRRINVRLIAPLNIKNIVEKYHSYKAAKIRYKLKYTKLRLPTGIFIFKNNIMTVVWGEIPTAFVITSKNNYNHYKEFFEEMWRITKK